MANRVGTRIRVGRCVVCDMPMELKRSDCKTCGTACRKALSRLKKREAKGRSIIRINGIDYDAKTGDMFGGYDVAI